MLTHLVRSWGVSSLPFTEHLLYPSYKDETLALSWKSKASTFEKSRGNFKVINSGNVKLGRTHWKCFRLLKERKTVKGRLLRASFMNLVQHEQGIGVILQSRESHFRSYKDGRPWVVLMPSSPAEPTRKAAGILDGALGPEQTLWPACSVPMW